MRGIEEPPVAPEAPAAGARMATGTPPSTCTPVAAGPLTDAQREAMADGMCRGTVCIFSPKEEALLRMAEASGRSVLIEKAGELRQKRQDDVAAVCARRRAEGKL